MLFTHRLAAFLSRLCSTCCKVREACGRVHGVDISFLFLLTILMEATSAGVERSEAENMAVTAGFF
jgi:hypothetical protein